MTDEQKNHSKYSEIGKGWYPLVDRLVADIRAVSPTTEFTQIKEKYGQLRVYVNVEPDDVSYLIGKAEADSEKICEICGERGENTDSGTGWYRTRCKKHYGQIAR